MDKILNIISNVFDIDSSSINMEMTPDDIESWDSLTQLFLINSIEEEFDIVLEIEEVFSIMKVGDIYDVIYTDYLTNEVNFYVDILQYL